MEVSSNNISNGYINQIAHALDYGMICFVNPLTYEFEDVPHDFLCGMYHDETCQEAVNRVDQWGQYITIDRPGHTESVEIMRSFVDRYIPKGVLKEELNSVLTLHRPDKNFHTIVKKSGYHDKWVIYNRRQMMKHIRRKLSDHIPKFSSLPSVSV
jgi:hypothetical protein